MAKTNAQLITQNDAYIRDIVTVKGITKVHHADQNKDMIEAAVNVNTQRVLKTVDPAAGVVLAMADKPSEHFVIDPAINAPKVWSMTDAAQGLDFKAKFVLTAANLEQTFPANWVVMAGFMNNATHKWLPPDPGSYVADGFWDGTQWMVSMIGPW